MATVYEELCTERGLPSIEEDPETRVVQSSSRPVQHTATPEAATAAPSPASRGVDPVTTTPLFDALAADWTLMSSQALH
jgi:hypothetical protein